MEEAIKICYNCEFWNKHWCPKRKRKGFGTCCYKIIEQKDCVDKHFNSKCSNWEIRTFNKLY